LPPVNAPFTNIFDARFDSFEKRTGMLLPFWLFAGGYLIIAAASLLEVDLRAAAGTRPPAANFCIAALVFAAMWPIRAFRGLMRACGCRQ
jgi:hypothetical protein